MVRRKAGILFAGKKPVSTYCIVDPLSIACISAPGRAYRVPGLGRSRAAGCGRRAAGERLWPVIALGATGSGLVVNGTAAVDLLVEDGKQETHSTDISLALPQIRRSDFVSQSRLSICPLAWLLCLHSIFSLTIHVLLCVIYDR